MYFISGCQNFAQALKSLMERTPSTERDDQILEKPGRKPSNLTKDGSRPCGKEAYNAAKDCINKNPKGICCTTDPSGNMTTWKVPDRATVKLQSADSGTTFYHHKNLSVM